MIRIRVKFLLTFLMLLFLNKTSAQDDVVLFDKFDFPKSIVRVIKQDSRGYLWIGTDNGLFRFDGNKYLVYRSDNSNGFTNLADNQIWSLIEDDKFNLWVGTGDGLSRINLISCSVYNYRIDKSDKQEIIALAKDNNGNIWAGVTGIGLVRVINYTEDKCQFKVYKHDSLSINSISDNDVWSIAFDKNNFGYAGTTHHGLNIFNADGDIKFRRIYKPDSGTNGLSKPQVDQIFIDYSQNKIWLISIFGLLECFDIPGKPLTDYIKVTNLLQPLSQRLDLGNTGFSCLTGDAKNGYWIASTSGLFHFYIAFQYDSVCVNKLRLFSSSNPKNHNLTDKEIGYVFIDTMQNIWVGSNTNLWKYNPQRALFQNSAFSKVFSSMYYKNPVGIYSDGVKYNLVAFDIDSVCLFNKNKSVSFCINSINKTAIQAIAKSEKEDWFFGTSRGLYYCPAIEIELAFANNKYIPKCLPFDATGSIDSGLKLSNQNIFALVPFNQNTLILGTSGGVYNLDINLKKVSIIEFSYNGYSYSKRSRCITIAVNSILLVGTDAGLLAYDLNANKQLKFNGIFKGDSLPEKYIHAIKTNKNLAWIGTTNGLYQIDFAKQVITKSKSIFTDALSIEERLGKLWIATNDGLIQSDLFTGIEHHYSENDGLLSSKFLENKSCILTDGSLAFVTDAGINHFNSQLVKTIKADFNFILEDVEVNRISIHTETADDNKIKLSFVTNNILNLTSEENDLTFKLTELSFQNASKMRFQYLLNGYDNSWKDYGTRTEVYYTKLPPPNYSVLFPGAYQFMARAITADNDTIFLKNPVSIFLKPAWNRSIEFYTLLGLFGLGILIYVVRYLAQQRLRQQIVEQDKELAVERERLRISRDLHDDLGAGLSSVAMMTTQIKELVTDEQAQDRAWEISNEANDLVTRMREIIWSMSSKNDTLENLIAYLNKYAKTYLDKNYLECKFQGIENFPDVMLQGDARRNIFLVVKESLHNIIKHSGATEVILNYELHQKSITLKICDNGKGFDMTNIHRFGNGLLNMKQRMENAAGTYEIESAPGKGTVTTLEITLG